MCKLGSADHKWQRRRHLLQRWLDERPFVPNRAHIYTTLVFNIQDFVRNCPLAERQRMWQTMEILLENWNSGTALMRRLGRE